MKYLAAIMLLAFSGSAAKAEVILMECEPLGKSLTRIVMIDPVRKQATFWVKFSPTKTNGPFGPTTADVSEEKVVWTTSTTSGKLSSTTRYVIDRLKKTMTTDITYNWDQDPWHEIAPCK